MARCRIALLVLAGGCGAATRPDVSAPVPPPDEATAVVRQAAPAEPLALAKGPITPADWWRTFVHPSEAPRWGRVAAGTELNTSAGTVRLERTRVGVLDTSSDRALVALTLRPITLIGTVALEDLQRTFIVTPTLLQRDDGTPGIELEPGAAVIPITQHALDGEQAPVIFEGRVGCESRSWQGSVPTAAIGRVVERRERTVPTNGRAGTLRGHVDLGDAEGETKLELGNSSPIDPLRAIATSSRPDGRTEVEVPFETFSLRGWVAPGVFEPDASEPSSNPTCQEALPISSLPQPSERETVLSLPEHTCLLGEDGSVAGVLSPPHVWVESLDDGTFQAQAPGATEVPAERLDAVRSRVWVPTVVGELPFIVSETGPAGGYRLCPPAE